MRNTLAVRVWIRMSVKSLIAPTGRVSVTGQASVTSNALAAANALISAVLYGVSAPVTVCAPRAHLFTPGGGV